jgi:hypothetical protein
MNNDPDNRTQTKQSPKKFKARMTANHPSLTNQPALTGFERIVTMSIPKFDSERYSEELFTVTESEHDEVMQLMADEDFDGYAEWSAALESPASENFVVVNGRLQHKPEPPSRLRLGGFEL